MNSSGDKLLFAQNAILRAAKRESMDDTLFVQLLSSEIGVIALGVQLVCRLFPELAGSCADLQTKLLEVSAAQDFFRVASDEEPTLEDE